MQPPNQHFLLSTKMSGTQRRILVNLWRMYCTYCSMPKGTSFIVTCWKPFGSIWRHIWSYIIVRETNARFWLIFHCQIFVVTTIQYCHIIQCTLKLFLSTTGMVLQAVRYVCTVLTTLVWMIMEYLLCSMKSTITFGRENPLAQPTTFPMIIPLQWATVLVICNNTCIDAINKHYNNIL